MILPGLGRAVLEEISQAWPHVAVPVPEGTDTCERCYTGDKWAVTGCEEACSGTISGGDEAGKASRSMTVVRWSFLQPQSSWQVVPFTPTVTSACETL